MSRPGLYLSSSEKCWTDRLSRVRTRDPHSSSEAGPVTGAHKREFSLLHWALSRTRMWHTGSLMVVPWQDRADAIARVTASHAHKASQCGFFLEKSGSWAIFFSSTLAHLLSGQHWLPSWLEHTRRTSLALSFGGRVVCLTRGSKRCMQRARPESGGQSDQKKNTQKIGCKKEWPGSLFIQ